MIKNKCHYFKIKHWLPQPKPYQPSKSKKLVWLAALILLAGSWGELLTQNPQPAQAAPIAQYSGGLLVYADGTTGTPKYKTFDDTSGFGTEQSASSVGSSAIEWIRVAASPTQDEWIIATRDAGDVIKAQVCTGVDGGVSCGSPTTITATAGTHGLRNYDVAYERTSGDALLVYGTATVDELRKIVWTGGSWGSDAAITTTRTAGAVEWVELTSRSASDQLGIAYSDTFDDVSAYRWSGTAVGDEATAVITATASTADVRKFDVSFEGTSGDMVVFSPLAAAGTTAYGQLSGTTWTITTDTDPDMITAFIDASEPLPSDDKIPLFAHGAAATSNTSEGNFWAGTTITDGNNGDDPAQNWAANYQLGAVAYLSTTYLGVAVFSSAAAPDDIDWWTLSTVTVTDQTVNTRTRGASRFIDLFDYPNANKVLLLTADANSDLWADTWAGAAVDATAWTDLTSGGAFLEDSLASATTDVVDFAFRLAPIPLSVTAPANVTLNPGNPGTTIETTFAADELVVVTYGSAGWSLTVQMTAALTKGSDTIPTSDVKLRTDGIPVGGDGTGDTYTIWSGVITFTNETISGTYSLDTTRAVGTRSSGTGGDVTNIRPTIDVVMPSGQVLGDYINGNIRFTVA